MPETFRIVEFEDRHARGFRDVNLAWIEELFWVEEEDARQLDNPRGIVDGGGEILVALVGEEVVGTCALVTNSKLACGAEAVRALRVCGGAPDGERLRGGERGHGARSGRLRHRTPLRVARKT